MDKEFILGIVGALLIIATLLAASLGVLVFADAQLKGTIQ